MKIGNEIDHLGTSEMEQDFSTNRRTKIVLEFIGGMILIGALIFLVLLFTVALG